MMEQSNGQAEHYRTVSYAFVGDVGSAAGLARPFLEHKLPMRWRHVHGVAAKAEELAQTLDMPESDKALLVVSAWFHDIGYGVSGPGYGWHPLDGALLLRGWQLDLVANQVAWHTTAEEEAGPLGLAGVLAGYSKPVGLVADALTYADMTTGPDGTPVTFEQRLVEVRTRRGPDSAPVRAMETAWARLLGVRTRIDEALAQSVRPGMRSMI